LAIADNFIRLGQARHALVIGAETFSRLLNWEDRLTCVLFGDGAGAVVLGSSEGKGDKTDRGILSTHLHSDGRHYNLLYTDGGPGSTGTTGTVKMEGQEVFRHAVVNLADVVDEALAASGLKPEEIDWLVPHQANQRIIDGTAKKLNMPPERVVMTIADHANTSAASIPLALATAVKDGRIKRGQLVLLDAMGGGFTWGAAMVRW
jgi:3-oxoacyl-[acyl-carrier-protein] synthase-3